MELSKMEVAELEERRNAIVSEIESPEADLDSLEEEMRSINDELQKRSEKAKADQEKRDRIAQNLVPTTVIEKRKEKPEMEKVEVRNSAEYIDAYANYIKTGDDKECRALLTENVEGGQVPVPDIVFDEIRVAWENDQIASRIRKSYIRGNLRVGFEISATGAVIHTEGSGPVDEETLVLGIVSIIPNFIKKWISISDETLSLAGEPFLRYVYREITHQIVKKVADEIVAMIEAAGTQSTASGVAVPEIVQTPSLGAIAAALANLSDQVQNPVIMMNKLTWGAFKAAQYQGYYAIDIFEGLPVLFNNTIEPYETASSGDTFAIVGDLGYGALANFPNGEELRFTFDDMTLATSDLVRVIGKEYIGLGLVAPYAFVKLVKGAEEQ